MGGSQSKAEISQLSQAITNVTMSTVQTCEVSAQQDQSVAVNNTGFKLWGTYKLEQQTEISSDCFSDVNKQAELQNNLINTISQAATAEGVALLSAFGASAADAKTNLTNIIENKVTMNNIQKSYNSIKQKQAATFNNSGVVLFEQVDLTQGGKIFAAATLQELDSAGIFNIIESYLDQRSDAKTENPLDFIANAFGAISSTILLVMFFFILIIIAAIIGAIVFMNSGAENPSPLIKVMSYRFGQNN